MQGLDIAARISKQLPGTQKPALDMAGLYLISEGHPSAHSPTHPTNTHPLSTPPHTQPSSFNAPSHPPILFQHPPILSQHPSTQHTSTVNTPLLTYPPNQPTTLTFTYHVNTPSMTYPISTHSRTHSLTHSFTLSHTLSYTLSYTLPPPLITHTLTHSHAPLLHPHPPPPLLLTHTLTHTHSHPFTPSHHTVGLGIRPGLTNE